MPLASHPAHAGTRWQRRRGRRAPGGGQEHVRPPASQLALVKPVPKALPERRPSCCRLGEFYTSPSGFVMMPEHQREMSEITHGMARTTPMPPRNSEVSRIKNYSGRRCRWSFRFVFPLFSGRHVKAGVVPPALTPAGSCAHPQPRRARHRATCKPGWPPCVSPGTSTGHPPVGL